MLLRAFCHHLELPRLVEALHPRSTCSPATPATLADPGLAPSLLPSAGALTTAGTTGTRNQGSAFCIWLTSLSSGHRLGAQSQAEPSHQSLALGP